MVLRRLSPGADNTESPTDERAQSSRVKKLHFAPAGEGITLYAWFDAAECNKAEHLETTPDLVSLITSTKNMTHDWNLRAGLSTICL